MIAQGLLFWPVSYLANHSDKLPYGIGHKYPNVADRVDEGLFLVLILGLIALHIWAYFAAQTANVAALRMKKGLRIVEAAEYMCQAEDKKFMPKDNEYTWKLHVPTVGFVQVASAPGVPSPFFAPGPMVAAKLHSHMQHVQYGNHPPQYQQHPQHRGGGYPPAQYMQSPGRGGRRQPAMLHMSNLGHGSPPRGHSQGPGQNGGGERSPLMKPMAAYGSGYGS